MGFFAMLKEKKVRSQAEELLAFQLAAVDLPFLREYRFAAIAAGGPGSGLRERLRHARLKDWRFDFAFENIQLAVEVEGLCRNGEYGRHQRNAGFHEDLVKYQEALKLGWTVYRVDMKLVKSGVALNTIELIHQRYQQNRGIEWD